MDLATLSCLVVDASLSATRVQPKVTLTVTKSVKVQSTKLDGEV